MSTKIFVYGTLMEGMVNHAFLKNSIFVSKAEIEGFDMYLLGAYPGIICGSGRIKGEVYEVSENTLNAIDELEGEGDLYLKTNAQTTAGDIVLLYVYNRPIQDQTLIPYEMQPYNKLVYYVSYGSNMLEERFLTYIKGGICRFNGTYYPGCINKCAPIKSVSIEIPYNMYFSKSSSSWDGSSVCFLDDSKPGFAYGRAYLVTQEQFEDIQVAECGGTVTNNSWYGKVINLNMIDGIPAKTFSNNKNLPHMPIETVKDKYLNVIIDGLKEAHHLNEGEINDYLKKIKCP